MSLFFAVFGVVLIGVELHNLYVNGVVGPTMLSGVIAIVYSYIRYNYLTKE